MFSNYLKIALRNLKRQKGFSLINIMGLAIGIASCLLIMIFVWHELSYDRFHKNAERIYRLPLIYRIGTTHFETALTPCPLAETMVKEYPEVEQATRIYQANYRGVNTFVKYKDREFKEEKFLFADPTVFDIFSIPLNQGNPQTALAQPFSIIITESMVKKYFINEDPMNKMLILDDGNIYRVTGITSGMPGNSHFHFDFLASFSSLSKSLDPDWYDTALFTYVLLAENTNPDDLNAKFPDLSRKYVAPVIEKITSSTYDDFIAADNYFGFELQALTDIHLHSKLGNEIEPVGSINTVIVFTAIAFIILLVASINFINLATAKSASRATEVGIRKVVGSRKPQLVTQFLVESVLLTIISVIIASILVQLALPVFNRIIGKELTLDVLVNWRSMPIILFSTLLIGLLAGAYPSFLFSSYRPVTVLKGKFHAGKKGRNFRNGLVIFQYTASIVLLIGTIIIYKQLQYFQNKDLGFDKDYIVVVKSAEKLGDQQIAFKNLLLQNPQVSSATYSDCLPQMLLEVKVYQKEGCDQENHTLISMFTDHDFQETYRVKMAQGRFFDRKLSTDSSAIILNEAAVKALNIADPLDSRLIYMQRRPTPLKIIGVFKDFHLAPLHEAISPMAAVLNMGPTPVLLSIRIKPGNVPETVRFIEKQWRTFLNGQPMEYLFFDDQFNQQYQAEIQAGKVVSAFAILAIIIACLGLLGLAGYSTVQRTKEIGVRKVLGSSVVGIVTLLFRDFVKYVLIATVLAWPLAWFLMDKWLQNFAYRVHPGPFPYLVAGLTAIIIALLTISYHSIKAAVSNPAHTLKYE